MLIFQCPYNSHGTIILYGNSNTCKCSEFRSFECVQYAGQVWDRTPFISNSSAENLTIFVLLSSVKNSVFDFEPSTKLWAIYRFLSKFLTEPYSSSLQCFHKHWWTRWLQSWDIIRSVYPILNEYATEGGLFDRLVRGSQRKW